MNINLVSPINNLGYGITGVNLVNALMELGHEVSLFPIGNPMADIKYRDSVNEALQNGLMPEFAAPCIRLWHQFDMSMFVGKGPKVGFPIFELDTLTEKEVHHLQHLNGIFVCSSWAKNVIINNVKTMDPNSIAVIPLGVDSEYFFEQESERQETIFFNCGKWEVRKGHDVLVEAFNRAFEEDDNVELWMMCENPFLSEIESYEWDRMYKTSKLGNKIRLIPRQDEQVGVSDIMRMTDCGVFPSRGEGWNLELLEMMACGKHVIATNNTGHTEFVNDENCMLIDCSYSEVAMDGKWFSGQGNWSVVGEPQIEQMVEHMREIHRTKQGGGLGLNKAGVETASHYSWHRTAEAIVNALSP